VANLADRVEQRKLQLATGHRSAAMAEHYSHHAAEADFADVSKAIGEAFSNIIPISNDRAV